MKLIGDLMAPKSRMLNARHKTAVDWTGPLDKHNRREDRAAASTLAKELAQEVPKMLRNIPVKGSNLYEWVHQNGGLRGLLGQTDPELKKAYYGFRSHLQQLLKDTDPTLVNRFYQEYGENPLDWGFIKTSRREMIMAKKARKTAAFTDKIIDVPVGQMRNEFESDFSGDDRNTETDHKDDKFSERNLPKGASKKVAKEMTPQEKDDWDEKEERLAKGKNNKSASSKLIQGRLKRANKSQMTCPDCNAVYFDTHDSQFGCPNCANSFTPAPKSATEVPDQMSEAELPVVPVPVVSAEETPVPQTLQDAQAQGYQWAKADFDDATGAEFWIVYREAQQDPEVVSIDEAIEVEATAGDEGPATIKLGAAFTDTEGEKEVPVVAAEKESIPEVVEEGIEEGIKEAPKKDLKELIQTAIEGIIEGLGIDPATVNYEDILEEISGNPTEHGLDEDVNEEEFSAAWDEVTAE